MNYIIDNIFFIAEAFTAILLTYLLITIIFTYRKNKNMLSTQQSIIQALGSTYENILFIDLDTKKVRTFQMSSFITKKYGKILPQHDYEKDVALYMKNEVYKDDSHVWEAISTTEKLDNILKDKTETSFSYRTLRGGRISHYQCELLKPNPLTHVAVMAFKLIDEFLWEKQYHFELKNIQENLNSGQWIIDFDENSQVVKCHWSEAARHLLGYSVNEDLPESFIIVEKILHPEEKQNVLTEFQKTISSIDGSYKFNVTHRLLTKKDGYRWFRSTGSIVRRKDGSIQHFMGIITDINEAQVNEIWLNKLLYNQSRQLELLSSLAGIYLTVHLIDLEKSVVAEINTTKTVKHFTEQLDMSIADMMRHIMETVVREDYLEQALQFTDMNTLPQRLGSKKTISLDFISKKSGWVRARFIAVDDNLLNITDETKYPVTETTEAGKKTENAEENSYAKKCFFVTQIIEAEKQKEEELMKMSNTDALTNFLNRHAYETDINKLEKLPVLPEMYIVTMDLNGLKVVNDTLGHDAGDELIKGAASCMKRAFGAYGSIYRTGGDEFQAILLMDTDISPVINDFRQIQQDWRGELVKEISISIGVTSKKEFPDLSLRELSKIADQRMYKEKSLFYSKKGTDRRGQQNATSIISNSYISILNVNIGSDSFKVVKNVNYALLDIINENDLFSTIIRKITERDFMDNETKEKFIAFFDAEKIKKHFSISKSEMQFSFHYYKKRIALIEIIPTPNFSELNPIVFICFKEITAPVK